MDNPLTLSSTNQLKLTKLKTIAIPSLITDAGDHVSFSFVEFFKATKRNPNTRKAYAIAVCRFTKWCELHGLALSHIDPNVMGDYFDEILENEQLEISTVKQHHSALNNFFDWMVNKHVFAVNPMYSVESPKFSQDEGKTPIMLPSEARRLLDSIDTSSISGLRDKALIGVMLFTFARVSAVLRLNAEHYFPKGKRWYIELLEKRNKRRQMPLNHKAEGYLDEYLEAAGIAHEKKKPIFRVLTRQRKLGTNKLNSRDCLAMIKRRVKHAGLPDTLGNHSCRGTGITAYLKNGGTMEQAQWMAGHADIKTTKLYDRRQQEVTVEMVEMVGI